MQEASWLVAAGASLILMLGAAHLLFTFRGSKLLPRDPALQARMQEVSPRISGQTTMWRAWIGFNASHSMGALLFGLVYLHLALVMPQALFGSLYLRGLGLAFLLGWALLGRRYWFSVPYRGVLLALLLYAAGLLLAALPSSGAAGAS